MPAVKAGEAELTSSEKAPSALGCVSGEELEIWPGMKLEEEAENLFPAAVEVEEAVWLGKVAQEKAEGVQERRWRRKVEEPGLHRFDPPVAGAQEAGNEALLLMPPPFLAVGPQLWWAVRRQSLQVCVVEVQGKRHRWLQWHWRALQPRRPAVPSSCGSALLPGWSSGAGEWKGESG